MYKSKKTGIIGIILTIIVLTVLVILTNIDTDKFSYAEGITNKLVMPIQNGMTYLKNKIFKNNAFFSDINNLKNENEELKQKNLELEESLRELEIIKAENETLREYAKITDKYTSYKTVPAYIIDKDISNFDNTIVINVGTKNGVYANMPVIASEGLVGYVVSSTKNTAKVQTIIDTSSSTSAILSISRDDMILKGTLENQKELRGTYIAADANFVLGDKVETSGLGGIYPKGILIGTLKEVVDTKNITARYAIVETAVDFAKLENVLVITEE